MNAKLANHVAVNMKLRVDDKIVETEAEEASSKSGSSFSIGGGLQDPDSSVYKIHKKAFDFYGMGIRLAEPEKERLAKS